MATIPCFFNPCFASEGFSFSGFYDKIMKNVKKGV
nr:MAG TPA: hypothetical protein [Caudoviricetes sp.]